VLSFHLPRSGSILFWIFCLNYFGTFNFFPLPPGNALQVNFYPCFSSGATFPSQLFMRPESLLIGPQRSATPLPSNSASQQTSSLNYPPVVFNVFFKLRHPSPETPLRLVGQGMGRYYFHSFKVLCARFSFTSRPPSWISLLIFLIRSGLLTISCARARTMTPSRMLLLVVPSEVPPRFLMVKPNENRTSLLISPDFQSLSSFFGPVWNITLRFIR